MSQGAVTFLYTGDANSVQKHSKMRPVGIYGFKGP